MKKNRFIKLASGLLMLCLLTACVFGTTLAKYTTASTSQDTARVAKWGVRVTAVADSSFNTEYEKNGTPGTMSVKSSSTDNVVAPGTTGDVLEMAVTGTPEVAVKLTFALAAVNEVKLSAGEYVNTDGATVNLAADYTPVVFTLKEGSDTLKTGTLAEIQTFLSTYTVEYPVNTNLSTKDHYTLEWNWAFEGNDVADSILGDLAAGVSGITKGGADIDAADYSTTVSYKLTITVTQVD